MNPSNLFPQQHLQVSKAEKEKLLHQHSTCFWLYGLSGSGKSTLAIEAERMMHNKGYKTVLLDGDNLRTGLNAGLGFSIDDRFENIRRAAEVSKIFVENGIIVIACFVCPLIAMRDKAREIIGAGNFHEIWVNASFDRCVERDVKGLYKKASAGGITNFTGVGQSFEQPENPNLIIHTDTETVEQSLEELINYVLKHI